MKQIAESRSLRYRILNGHVTVVMETLPSGPELTLVWVLSAEAAPLSCDTSRVSLQEDRDKSSRVGAPVADSFNVHIF